MTNVVRYAIDAYVKNIRMLLLFSLAFIVAFFIPVFASFPTFTDLGGIFVRSASVLQNLNPLTTLVIVVAVFLSTLFLSFAMVAINVVIKHSRTMKGIGKEVLKGLENYTGLVFAVLILYSAIVVLTGMLTHSTGYSAAITAIVGLVLAPFFFYAPASIVIDDSKILRAFKKSAIFFVKRIDYVLLWLVVGIALLSIFDIVFTLVGGQSALGIEVSSIALLIFNSLFIIPFMVVLQSELYMKRFPLLKS